MAGRHPKEVLIARHSGRERLVQVLVKMKDIVGSFADVNRITAGEGVDLRQSVTYSVRREKEKYAIYSAFAAVREGFDPRSFALKLKESPFVLDAQVMDGVEGSIVDTLLFPLNFAGERAVLMEAKAVVSMFEDIQKTFGTGGSVIIYQLGSNYGHALTETLSATLSKPYMVKNHHYGLQILASTGWGIPKVVDEDESLTNLVVRIDECFICKGKRKGSEGYFMAGFLAGIFTFLSGKELKAVETRCVARGDDACEFAISPVGKKPSKA